MPCIREERESLVVNWLKVRTKVSVESLCVQIIVFGPKVRHDFQCLADWRTFSIFTTAAGDQARGAGPLPAQSSLTRRTSRMAVPLKSDSRIDPSGR